MRVESLVQFIKKRCSSDDMATVSRYIFVHDTESVLVYVYVKFGKECSRESSAGCALESLRSGAHGEAVKGVVRMHR